MTALTRSLSMSLSLIALIKAAAVQTGKPHERYMSLKYFQCTGQMDLSTSRSLLLYSDHNEAKLTLKPSLHTLHSDTDCIYSQFFMPTMLSINMRYRSSTQKKSSVPETPSMTAHLIIS